MAVKAIESVHRVASLQPIPVNETRSRSRAGDYLAHAATGRPIAIEITSRKGEHPELSFVHEIDHFLEQAAIPGHLSGQRRWGTDDLTMPFLQTALNTRAVASLRRIHEQSQGDPFQRYTSYLLRPEELWARCYAQYITIRSANATPVGQLERMRSPQAQNAIQLQWLDDDFEPVVDTIDALFRSIGWHG